MNIWIFNHYATGPDSSGGTRHYDLAQQLVKKGHSVTIFASSFNHQTLSDDYLKNSKEKFKETLYNGVKFIWIKTIEYRTNNHKRVINMISYSRKASKIAEKQKDQPDIVIGSLVHPLAAYTGYIVAKKKKCIFYFEERDLWPQTLIDLGKISKNNPLISVLSKLEIFLFQKSTRIIVLFDKAVGYVESKGISKDKVIYIPNGFDTERSDIKMNISPSIEKVFDDLKGKTLAIYTGAHGKANNLDVILDSAKELETRGIPVHFLFVGNGPEKERLKKRTLVERINNVTLLDPVKKEMIPELLKRVDIGLLPLVDSPVFKWGISPNKLFDYMGASLPVLLLCNLDGTPVEKANGGKVIKTNFKTEIVKFFSEINKDELDLLGSNGKEYVTKYHSWEKLALELEEKMLIDCRKM